MIRRSEPLSAEDKVGLPVRFFLAMLTDIADILAEIKSNEPAIKKSESQTNKEHPPSEKNCRANRRRACDIRTILDLYRVPGPAGDSSSRYV